VKTYGCLMALILTCAGCQSGGFTRAQVAALQQEGFSQNSEGWGLGLPNRILFGINESELTAASKQRIASTAGTLAATGITHLRIDGHTDNYGEAGYNQQLSLRRADAVAQQWAASSGVPRANIVTRGLGMRVPVASNSTSQGRAQNRRVAIVITAP